MRSAISRRRGLARVVSRDHPSCCWWRRAPCTTSMVLNALARTVFAIRRAAAGSARLEARAWTMRAELDRKTSPTGGRRRRVLTTQVLGLSRLRQEPLKAGPQMEQT